MLWLDPGKRSPTLKTQYFISTPGVPPKSQDQHRGFTLLNPAGFLETQSPGRCTRHSDLDSSTSTVASHLFLLQPSYPPSLRYQDEPRSRFNHVKCVQNIRRLHYSQLRPSLTNLDALELVHPRRLLPLARLANHQPRRLRRHLHRGHPVTRSGIEGFNDGVNCPVLWI